MYMASSGVARGIIPGSVKLVFSNVDMTNTNNMIVAIGISGLTLNVRYGQLHTREMIYR